MTSLDNYEKYYICFITEPFIGTTGKCHQQRLASDKKTTTPLSQQQRHTHSQQPPLPTLVAPPEDSQQAPQQQTAVAMRPVGCAELQDLIHLAGPLTEDAVLKCLQARFCASQFFVSTSRLFWLLTLPPTLPTFCSLLPYNSPPLSFFLFFSVLRFSFSVSFPAPFSIPPSSCSFYSHFTFFLLFHLSYYYHYTYTSNLFIFYFPLYDILFLPFSSCSFLPFQFLFLFQFLYSSFSYIWLVTLLRLVLLLRHFIHPPPP